MNETLLKIWTNVLGFSTAENPTSIPLGFLGIGFVLCLILGVAVSPASSMYCSFVVVGGLVLNFFAAWYLQGRKNKREEAVKVAVTPTNTTPTKEKVENEIPKANEYKRVESTETVEKSVVSEPVAKATTTDNKPKTETVKKTDSKPKTNSKKSKKSTGDTPSTDKKSKSDNTAKKTTNKKSSNGKSADGKSTTKSAKSTDTKKTPTKKTGGSKPAKKTSGSKSTTKKGSDKKK